MSAIDFEHTGLAQVWHGYGAGGPDALRHAAPSSPRAALYAALLTCAGGDRATARAHAARALEMAPESALAQEMQRYLTRNQEDAFLYAEGEAFAAFIRGGGNQLLYQRLTEALRRRYRQHHALRLLDIGVGDGLALLSALDDARVAERVAHVDLVEPSASMLARVAAALARQGVSHTAHNATLESFAQDERAPWDMAQATFSLQCIAPERRADALAWLRRHCHELIVAEFDAVPFAEPHGPARAAFLLERYERGIAEYTEDRTLVAQGFLVPILISLFTGDANQNFEQPIAAWEQACTDAGFADVRAQRLCGYWWSDAYLLSAR